MRTGLKLLLPTTIVIIMLLTLAACKQGGKPSQSSSGSAPKAAASPSADGNAQPPAVTTLPGPPIAASHNVQLEIGVDPGAQLLLMDSAGRRTGYDPSSKQNADEIPGAAYTNESATASGQPANASAGGESRVIHLKTPPGQRYLLRVTPAGRPAYRLSLRCKGQNDDNAAAGLTLASTIEISAAEVHQFVISPQANCAVPYLSGAIVKPSQQNPAALSYAWPPSAHVQLAKGHPARIVIIYGRNIAPSSFAATLNGQPVTQLFHPEPGKIESVVLPTKAGENTVELKAGSAANAANTAGDKFVFVVE